MSQPKLKTLLINHPNKVQVDFFSGNGRTQPLNLAYLAAYLQKYNYPVEILDADVLGLSHEQVVDEIKKRQPDLIGLSAVTPTFFQAVKLAQKIKKIPNSPLIVLGGNHITALPAEMNKYPCFDLAVLGEGEQTLLELVKALRIKAPLEQIKGLAFRQGRKLVITPNRPFIKNLDEIPHPAVELLPPIYLYHPSPGMYRKRPMTIMMTSRACPYQCVFCSRTVFGNNHRAHSPEYVVEEMEELVKKYGIREIRLCDDIFNVSEERVLKICRLIRQKKLNLSWGCSLRANLVTKKMLQAIKSAGCWQVGFGIESGNQKILKIAKKNLELETVEKAVNMVREVGMEARGFFMIGLPGETEETMQQTIDFAKKLKLDVANFYITVPFPGTELAKDYSKYGRVNQSKLKNYLSQTTSEPPFVPYGLTAKQVLKAYKQAYRQFYLRPGYLLTKMLKIRSLGLVKSYPQALFSIAARFLK